MPDSNITVSGLVAEPGIQQIKLSWDFEDVAGPDYLTLDAVEVWSGMVNDRALAALVGEDRKNFTHAGLAEEVMRYYWIRPRADAIGPNGELYYGEWHPTGSTSGISAKAIGMSSMAFGFANLQIVATVASNNLTVAIKNGAGANPSAGAGNAVYLSFRNAALSSGATLVRELISALSLIVAQTASAFGTANGESFRIWVVIFDDSGTLRLGLQNCYGRADSEIFTLNGRASPANVVPPVAGRFYSDATISDKPYRIIGYLEWTDGLPVAGTFSAGPDVVHLLGPGTKLPGDIVYEAVSYEAGGFTTTELIPYDGTIPQYATDGEFWAYNSITPTSPANVLEASYELRASYSVAATLTLALFRDSAANAVVADAAPVAGSSETVRLAASYRALANTTAEIDFDWKVGGSTAGTFTHVSGLGGIMKTPRRIAEIMA